MEAALVEVEAVMTFKYINVIFEGIDIADVFMIRVAQPIPVTKDRFSVRNVLRDNQIVFIAMMREMDV